MAYALQLEQLTQLLAVVGQIPASNHTNNTDNSVAGIDMSRFIRLITYLDVGVLGTNANVVLTYYGSANSNMAGAAAVGSTVTGSTSNRVESLEIRADQLAAGTRYIRPSLTVNTASANVGLIALATGSYHPSNQFNVANVLDQGIVS